MTILYLRLYSEILFLTQNVLNTERGNVNEFYSNLCITVQHGHTHTYVNVFKSAIITQLSSHKTERNLYMYTYIEQYTTITFTHTHTHTQTQWLLYALNITTFTMNCGSDMR